MEQTEAKVFKLAIATNLFNQLV